MDGLAGEGFAVDLATADLLKMLPEGHLLGGRTIAVGKMKITVSSDSNNRLAVDLARASPPPHGVHAAARQDITDRPPTWSDHRR